MICGVDEAGRGCVIGPLVICAAKIDKKDEGELLKLGVKDSKLLTKKKREELAALLKNKVKYKIIVIPAREIDDCIMRDSSSNLNWLEAMKTIELIDFLKPREAFIDCPSTNVRAYSEFIRERLLDSSVKAVIEHKADLKYPIAAAASILAKVARDTEIEKIKKEVNFDFGSGYMSDVRTSEFLEKFWEVHPTIFRHSWAPYKKLKQAAAQKGLLDF